MSFQVGNRFWEARSSHGRNPIFATPEDLWKSCVEYFEWAESHPLYEDKIFQFQGAIVRDTVAKMRAMTIEGMCIFLDIDRDTWLNYKKRPDFFGVTTRAESVIYEQKFTGAAADLLNPNIIARDLGLADKKDHTSSDGSMSPKESSAAVLDALKRKHAPQ
jgi:hypothetical protein